MKKKIRIAIDIDGVLCQVSAPYKDCKPIFKNIEKVNRRYEKGYTIILFTSRYQSDRKITMKWLRTYGVKYHKLILGKPKFDKYIDEKNKVEGW